MRCLHRLWRGFLLGCLATKLLLLLIPLLLLLLLFFSFFLSFFSFFSYFFVFLDLNEGQKLRNRDMFVKAALGSSFWLAWSLVSHWQVADDACLAYPSYLLLRDIHYIVSVEQTQTNNASSIDETAHYPHTPHLRLPWCHRSWRAFFRGLLLSMRLLNLRFCNFN